MYDKANQLVRENNQGGNYTHTWTYDDAGNILSRNVYDYTTDSLEGLTPVDTVVYSYSDTLGWGDLLTAYDGQTFVYDGVGNPLTQTDANGNTVRSFQWKHGRQLAAMTVGGQTWTYTYNADGLRTKARSATRIYEYVYNGSQLTQMTRRYDPSMGIPGTDTMYFSYDASGVPLTVTYNGTVFYYITNVQGDVVGIMNSAGQQVVSYSYDAWGNLLSTGGSLANTLGILNPLRYRGYVYDTETQLYYLQSRYYDPQIGRFINADALPSTGQGVIGNNMFAYCGNNPVVRTEIGGFFWDTVFDIVSLCFSVAEVIENPDDPMAWLGVAADVASLVIPCVSGGGALVKAASKADDVVDAVKTIDKVDDAVDTAKAIDNTQTAIKVHGNSLSTTKETVGYALRKNGTDEIMKFGETTRGFKRYTNKFYRENDVYMDIMEIGTKRDMHMWQHNQILDYYKNIGKLPPMNKSFW